MEIHPFIGARVSFARMELAGRHSAGPALTDAVSAESRLGAAGQIVGLNRRQFHPTCFDKQTTPLSGGASGTICFAW